MNINNLAVYRRYPNKNGYDLKLLNFKTDTLENILQSPTNTATNNLIFVLGQKSYTLQEFKVARKKNSRRKVKPITKDAKEQVISLRDKGFSYSEIHQKTAIPRGSLTYICKNLDT